MKNHKKTSKIFALGAAVALTAAACGSDDAEVVDEPVTTEAMEEEPVVTDAMEEDAMEEDAMEEDAMEEDAMEEDAMEEDAMEEDAMEEDAMEEDAMEEDAMEEDAMEEDAMEEDAMEEGDAAALEPSGPLCAEVPADGEGSFAGMTDDPAATAASNNPALSTLVAAVDAAGLVDTLNGDGPFTIFAPANPAFDALPEGALDGLLADTDALTSLLTLHVFQGEQLSSVDLSEMDSIDTLGGTLTLEVADDGSLMVNGQATVGCADVSTANATVHIIDAVLMP